MLLLKEVEQVPSGFKNLSSIEIYTPDLGRALELYRALGLESGDAGVHRSSSAGTVAQLTLCFNQGGTDLVLHSDPQRQFVELGVGVEDVAEIYRQLARNPVYSWLETPHVVDGCWRAVVRLPDDNIFTLRSPVRSVRPY